MFPVVAFGVTTTQVSPLPLLIQTGAFVAGTRTFAVGDDKVLLYGGYGDRRTACNLLSLDDRDARLVAEVSLVLPREIDLTKDTVIGRDKGLHVFLGDDWYLFSIDSLD